VLPAVYVVGAWTEESMHVNHWVLEIKKWSTVQREMILWGLKNQRVQSISEPPSKKTIEPESNQSVNHQEKKTNGSELESNQSMNQQEKKLVN
jgi:hypothetical protein